MSVVTTMLSGRVSTTTRVSSGLIVSIITMTPTTVTTEVMSCVRFCCKRGADVVHVVDGAAENLAVRPRVVVLERQVRKFLVDLPAHRIDRLLRHASHDVLLDVAEDRADADTARPGSAGYGRCKRKSIVAPGTCWSFSTIPVEELRDRQAKDLRANDVEDGAEYRRDQHRDQVILLRSKVAPAGGRASHGNPWPSAPACRSRHRAGPNIMAPGRRLAVDGDALRFWLMRLPPQRAATGRFRGRPRFAPSVAMRADIHHAPLVQDEDLVGVHDRADTLGDDQHCGVRRFVSQRRAQSGVRGIIERGEAVVEDVDFRLPYQRAGNREALLLAAREIRATLCDLPIQSRR